MIYIYIFVDDVGNYVVDWMHLLTQLNWLSMKVAFILNCQFRLCVRDGNKRINGFDVEMNDDISEWYELKWKWTYS